MYADANPTTSDRIIYTIIIARNIIIVYMIILRKFAIETIKNKD